MVVNAALAIGLAPVIGWAAPAVATTIAGWAMLGLLYLGLRGMGDVVRVDDRYRHRLPRIVLAAGVMGVMLWLGSVVLQTALETAYVRYAALLGLIVLGAVSFFGAAHISGGLRLSDLKKSLRR